MSHLAVKGCMYADGLLATSILLMNCTLDDTRNYRRSSAVRIMERTSEIPILDNFGDDKDAKTRSMLDVTVRMGPKDMFGKCNKIDKKTITILLIKIRLHIIFIDLIKNSFTVDVKVFSFSIIISLDYLMKIKDFFTAGLPDQQSSSQASQKMQHEMMIMKKKVQTQPVPAASDNMMTINLHIEKPDIILMEDMDDIDSNCILLNVSKIFFFINQKKGR